MPTVSIGLPVYNAEESLPALIKSIQSQSYKDYEVVVFDNCSTDGSTELLRNYARNDGRVKLSTRTHNAGYEENFKDVLIHSTGQYFTWWAADDWRSADWLEACLNAFQENPQAAATMAPYCFDFDINNTDNWHRYTLEGESRLITLIDNYHLSHSAFYSLIKKSIAVTWLDEQGFLPINGSDWLFILYLACRGDIVRTPSALMVGGTNGVSRRGWTYQRTLLEVQAPLYDVYAKIDEMIRDAEAISITQKFLASAKLMARKYEVGDQLSQYWPTLDSPLVPLVGFGTIEGFDEGMLVQWCHINAQESKMHEAISVAMFLTSREVDVYIINPGLEDGEVTLFNSRNQRSFTIVVHPGKNIVDITYLRQVLMVEGCCAINLIHTLKLVNVHETIETNNKYFGIARDFKPIKGIESTPSRRRDHRLNNAMRGIVFTAKCAVRNLITKVFKR